MSDGKQIVIWAIIFGSAVLMASALFALIGFLERKKIKILPPLHLSRRKPKTLRITEIEGIQLVEQKLTITEIDTLLSHRIAEAKVLLKQFERQEKINVIVDGLLIFGQYIVGGVLTVSFVQSNLTQENLGFIGLLVLLATLLRQFYRPDVKERNAKGKTIYLKSLIRKTENFMTMSHGKNLKNILDELTQGLNRVDQEDEWDHEKNKEIK